MHETGKWILSPTMAFVVLAACAAAVLLVIVPLTSSYKGGCGGAPSPTPCDYEATFRSAAGPYFNDRPGAHFVFTDREATMEVSQQMQPVVPGGSAHVVIDKLSCRVCEVSLTQ